MYFFSLTITPCVIYTASFSSTFFLFMIYFVYRPRQAEYRRKDNVTCVELNTLLTENAFC